MTTKNIFYWGTGAFSGSGQLDEGPFIIGDVDRLLRAKVRGMINYQGSAIGDTGVEANLLMWGLQWGVHGYSPLDVVTSTDNDYWLLRLQTGQGDPGLSFAPSSDTGANLRSRGVADNWAGQLAVYESIDAYLSFAQPFGGSVPNLNTYGTVEFWWS